MLVFNTGKEVENPRDWSLWWKFKEKSFMSKSKLPELLEHFSLNLLIWPKQSNRDHTFQTRLCFYLFHVFLRTTSGTEIQIKSEIWSHTYQLTTSVTNQTYYYFQSPSYHYWKSALIAAYSQEKNIYLSSNTPGVLKRTILPLSYRYWSSKLGHQLLPIVTISWHKL